MKHFTGKYNLIYDDKGSKFGCRLGARSRGIGQSKEACMISCIRILSMIFFLFFSQGFFVSSHCHGSEADRSFTLQVLFGAIKDDASRCLKKLRKKGHEAYIYETTNEAGEKLYRVRVGQFKTERG